MLYISNIINSLKAHKIKIKLINKCIISSKNMLMLSKTNIKNLYHNYSNNNNKIIIDDRYI